MYSQIKNAHPKTQHGFKAVKKFKKAVKELDYKKDILIRTGNEVILDLANLPALPEVNNPPRAYIVQREARIENNPERQVLNNVVNDQDAEIDHKRKPESQGGSSKRLRK